MRLSFFLFCLAFGCRYDANRPDRLPRPPSLRLLRAPGIRNRRIKVEGAYFAEENAIIGVTGLSVGQDIRIPGPDIPRAIKNLWRLRLFTNVSIEEEKRSVTSSSLPYASRSAPAFLRHSFTGAKQSRHDDLNEEVNKYIVRGGIVTEDAKVNAAEAIRNYYVEKGYLDATVTVEEIHDTSRANSVRLLFDINRNDRVKIAEINVIGNDAIKETEAEKADQGNQ